MKSKHIQKGLSCSIAFTISFSLAPIFNSALLNSKVFEKGLNDAICLSLIAAIIICISINCFLYFLTGRNNKHVRTILLFVSSICILNSVFFTWNLGNFDGRGLDLGEYIIWFAIEVVSVCAIIVSFIFFSKQIEENYIAINVALIISAILPVIVQSSSINAIMENNAKPSLSFNFSDEQILNFSKERNVFVFILDAMQTDNFINSFNKNTHVKNAFKGFTCFRNNSGIAPNTTFAVPAIISGIPYTGEMNKDDYISTVMNGTNALPVILNSKGYDSRIFTQHTIPYYPGIKTWNNVVNEGRMLNAVKGWLALLRLSLYKISPLLLKIKIRDEKFFVKVESAVTTIIGQKKLIAERYDDAGLLEKIAKDGISNNPKSTLRWFHLQGLHEPLTLVSKSEQEIAKTAHEDILQIQADRLMGKFAIMLQALRRLNIYDSSIIFVVGDHGLGDKRKPVMLLKPLDAKGDLIISDAPTSVIDIPATIIDEPSINFQYKGLNVLTLNKSSRRERFFYEFYSIDQSSGLPKMLSIQKLESQDNLAGNWKTITQYQPALKGKEDRTSYTGFTINDNIDPKVVRGNYVRTIGGIEWSDWLELDVKRSKKYTNFIEILYYRTDPEPARIEILVDKLSYGEYKTDHYGHLNLLLPIKFKELHDNSSSTIHFKCLTANRQKNPLLFVDMLITELGNYQNKLLSPEKTGVNCNLNAAWGAGGDFWKTLTNFRVFAVYDGKLLPATINKEQRFYSFLLPNNLKIDNYYLIDVESGNYGPVIPIKETCGNE